MKHVLDQYKDKELLNKPRKIIERAKTFSVLFQIHSEIQKIINTEKEIGVEVKKQ